MADHHPADDMLAEYAAGTLSEPASLLVATHLALCPGCRSIVAAFEAVGGALLEDIAPQDGEAGLAAMLARLDEPAGPPPPPASVARADLVLPQPLRDLVGGSLDRVAWRRLSASISYVDVLPRRNGAKTRLLRIRPGTVVPSHRHDGPEHTLLLAGGLTDEAGHYRRGDVAIMETGRRHRPVADPDAECICLAVEEGRLRFEGPAGWLYGLVDGRR